jgi:hypothetical protein
VFAEEWGTWARWSQRALRRLVLRGFRVVPGQGSLRVVARIRHRRDRLRQALINVGMTSGILPVIGIRCRS